MTGKDRKHNDNEDSCDDESNEDESGEDESDEYESSADNDDRSEDDVDFEFMWLEPIDAEMTSTSTLDERGEPKNVAHCKAKLIRRGKIHDDFYAEMEQPSRETSMLAFDLFDRYGRLRPEFKTHPIIRGTGVWGQEIDRGDILLIEEIFVNQACRRQQLGRKMVEAILALVRPKTRSFVAFVRPNLLTLHDIELEWDSLQSEAAKDETEDRERDRAVMFYRSLGFRRVGSTIWFAMACDNEHPSRKLASTEDFDPSRPPLTALHSLFPFQQISDPPLSAFDQMLSRQPRQDPDYLSVLHDCMKENGSADACWPSKDKYGNTVLHLAAAIFDSACVEWILNQDFGTSLLQSRNHRGETPLELLQFKLEKLRTQRCINAFTASISDEFKGHNENAVRCLILLKRLDHPELGALQQIFGGCTCGQCLEGFLSPRMLHALRTQASTGCNMDSDIHKVAGPEWVSSNYGSLNYLPSRVRSNLNTNKSMRQGFVKVWKHIATCLERREVPSERNVLDIVKDTKEWPPTTRNFLQRGGTVEPVFLAICKQAMEEDEWTRHDLYVETCGEDIADLPEFRNDLEFAYVSGACGYRRITLVRTVDWMGNTLDEDGNIIDSLR